MSIHADLVASARSWLKKGHSVVLTEIACGGGECADAIGFTSVFSTLVECKASRSDFLADKGKQFRQFPTLGMGVFRYYMAPAGIIALDDLPPCWGLAEVHGNGRVRVKRMASPQQANASKERALLVSVLRRVAKVNPPGADVRFYPVLTSAFGTIGIEEETDIPDMFDAGYQYGYGDATEDEAADPRRVEAAWEQYKSQGAPAPGKDGQS